jgi:hypothetical protein
MNRKITPVSFTRIPKMEVSELVNTFVSIVDHYGAEKMFISDTVTALRERMPKLESLNVPQRKHPESPLIQALLTKRKEIIVAMAKQSRTLAKANLSTQAGQMQLLAPFFERYWGDIYNFNQKTINRRVELMFAEIESNEELQTALQGVGLSAYTDELKVVEADLSARREVRRKEKSLHPKVNTKEVKSDLGEVLTDVVNAIELAVKAHPALDYTPMISEINQLFASYQSEIKSRTTRNKNANSTPTATDMAANAPKDATAA